MMPNDDPDQVMMIQIQWWYRSRDDAPEMIQIEWWSRSSSDDPDPVMISNDDDLDQVMIHIQRRRWIEDKEELKTKKTWRCKWQDDPVDTKKKTSAENCVERIPS